jgi:hypothetical protein
MSHEPRILFLDIETKPALVYSFGIRDQHLTHKQIAQDGGTICVGLSWLGEKKVRVVSEWEHGYQGMLDRVHRHLCEADAVASYNGIRFDMPKLMGNFLMAGMEPPPPPTQIDIFKTVRKMGLICNKLDYVAPLLGLGAKLKHEGLEMWIAVMNGDERARRKMARYCAQDVRLLKDVYERVQPYITNHPRLKAGGECSACNSNNVQRRGYNYSKQFKTERIFCLDCRGWTTGKRTAA